MDILVVAKKTNMRVKRQPRINFHGVGTHKRVVPQPPLWQTHGCLLCGTITFLGVAIAAVVFFLGESDIVTFSGLRSWTRGGGSSVVVQCRTDADCENCCKDYTPSHLRACLLPPNSSSASCVKGCCVPPQPIPQVSGVSCDDYKWCTVSDACDGNGQCVGVPRSCVDENFCTLETCSEDLGACVGGVVVDDASICENECQTDEECRTDFFCAQGRCARFTAMNTSLFFLGYEIVSCNDSPHGFAMVQQYSVVELGYSLNIPQADGGGMRYRALLSSGDIILPVVPASDAVTLELLDAFGAQTRIVPAAQTTPAYSEISFSVRTECVPLEDAASCLTVWMDRKYNFELDVQDCSIKKDDPLGPILGNTIGECMPVKIRRPFAMNLDVIDCPFFEEKVIVPRQASVRVEYYDQPGAPIVRAGPGRRLRVVVEPTEEERALSFGGYDPFLTDVTYCGVRDDHRLAHCVYNEGGECPFRGCRGWSGEDSPITFVTAYMENTNILAPAIIDLVEFCRGNGTLYEPSGCVPGFCDWSLAPNRTGLGNADGFAFYLDAPMNSNIVIDVQYRFEMCNEDAARRRLVEVSRKRRIGALEVVAPP